MATDVVEQDLEDNRNTETDQEDKQQGNPIGSESRMPMANPARGPIYKMCQLKQTLWLVGCLPSLQLPMVLQVLQRTRTQAG